MDDFNPDDDFRGGVNAAAVDRKWFRNTHTHTPFKKLQNNF